jgi:4,5-dihydroxyphthalate decarboxylase
MPLPVLRYIGKDYDYLAPLACGDVEAEGMDLRLERSDDTMAGGAAQVRFLATPEIESGEYSFSLFLIGLSKGDRTFVGLPFFPTRGFRHRCLYVRRDSGFTSARDLEGRRVGLNAWKTTGNTWTRAALREEGAELSGISWVVGPMDGSGRDAAHHKPQLDLPPSVSPTPPGRTLEGMLLDGELDAMMSPAPPPSFYGARTTVRLYANYRRVEQDYYRRTAVCPAHHLVVIRREVVERDPTTAVRLYDALERSKCRWQARRRALVDTTPWFQDEIDEATRVFGGDWQPNGVAANSRMIAALCREQFEQGLVERRLDPEQVFAEFARAADDAGYSAGTTG